MNYETWTETYKPVTNSMVDGAAFSGWMFETYGEELEQVKLQPENHIWTIRDEDGGTSITAGYGFVNRLGYLITSKPWTTGDEYIQISEEVECECFIEDGWTDSAGESQNGNPDCGECEGYGLVTKWID
jgi:hypothetical protein